MVGDRDLKSFRISWKKKRRLRALFLGGVRHRVASVVDPTLGIKVAVTACEKVEDSGMKKKHGQSNLGTGSRYGSWSCAAQMLMGASLLGLQ